jgi:hypothetical protein
MTTLCYAAGHAIRETAPTRFGVLFHVGRTDSAFSTIEQAQEYAAAHPVCIAILCIEYAAWNEREGLKLGSADEHLHDESLTDAQRAWLADFSARWESVGRQ